MAETTLDASRVVSGIGQGIAAGMAEHVGVDRKGEFGAAADALDQPVDGVGGERTAALGCEDEARVRGLPPQLAQHSHLVAAERVPADFADLSAPKFQARFVDQTSAVCRVFNRLIVEARPAPRAFAGTSSLAAGCDDEHASTFFSGSRNPCGLANNSCKLSLTIRSALANMPPATGAKVLAYRRSFRLGLIVCHGATFTCS
jgi:hypothetical protein